MAPLDILKCSGPSFPVGFSTSRTWRLTVSFIAFPPYLSVLDAIGGAETGGLHRLCAAHDASRRRLIPQREHCSKCLRVGSELRRPRNLPNSEPPELTGVRNVQQVYAIHPDRDGAWHCDGVAGLQLSSRYPHGYRILCKPDRDAVPAPDQDDHRAARV